MRDYKGQKFNRLTMIANIGPGGGTRGRLWLATCECGNSLEVPAKDVAAGRVKSCGKCPEELGIPGKKRGGYRARSMTEAKLRRLIMRTAKAAEREGVPFALTTNDLATLVLKECFLCRQELEIHTLTLKFDNPREGYTVSHIRAICPNCKRHMAGDNLREYLEYVYTLQHLFR